MLCGDLGRKEIQEKGYLCFWLITLLLHGKATPIKKCLNPRPKKKKNPKTLSKPLSTPPPPTNHPPEFCSKYFLAFLYSFTTSIYIPGQ